MRQDRDEDLHVGLAAPGAKGQRLAGEVRHPVKPGLVVEVHLRRAAATDLVRLQARAELAVAVRLPALGLRPRRGTPPKACGASRAPGAACAWLEAHGAHHPSPADAYPLSRGAGGYKARTHARHRRDRTAMAMTAPPPARRSQNVRYRPRAHTHGHRDLRPGQAQVRDGAEGCLLMLMVSILFIGALPPRVRSMAVDEASRGEDRRARRTWIVDGAF